ncbi:MAG: choice-of-anchor J domain-containing protein [Bacteroidetes bacterium]|nr:choice-of-anchor J domain-containing protein [Bacteroidota bacterium]
MKKVIIISFCFILSFFIIGKAHSQNVIWSEDFEGNWSNDWYADFGNWQVGTPTIGPGSAHSGLNCATVGLNVNCQPNFNSRLININSFVIPDSNQNPRLRFWHWWSIPGCPYYFSTSYAYVQIKENGSSDWINISPGGNIWNYAFIDLKSYAGKTVQIAFFYHSDCNGGPGWYIDDISLQTGQINFSFPENFEAGMGFWYSDFGSWQVGKPTIGPQGGHNSLNCATIGLEGNCQPNFNSSFNSRLISPVFIIPDSNQNPRLRFWHWWNIPGCSYYFTTSYASVQIKENDSSNWITISPQYIGTGGNIWNFALIDLESYAGKTVQIAFFYHSDCNGGPGWYIDDIDLDYTRYYDVGTYKIIGPQGIIKIDSVLFPKAIVKNYGLNPETFNTKFSIDPVYSSIKQTTLQPGQTDTLSFDSWIATPAYSYKAKCKSLLSNDEDIRNDSLESTVIVSSGHGPEIYTITPDHGGNFGNVTVEITGNGFMPGARVKLTRSGQQDIVADSSVTQVPNANKIITTFVMDSAQLGQWNLAITNPDSLFTVFYNGFTIENNISELWVNITGNQKLLSGTESLYVISYGNNGNTDENSAEIIIWFNKLFSSKIYKESVDSSCIINPSLIAPDYYDNNVGYIVTCSKISPSKTNTLFLMLSGVAPPHTHYPVYLRISNALHFLTDSTKSINIKNNIVEFKNNKKHGSDNNIYSVCMQLWGREWGGFFPNKNAIHPMFIFRKMDNSGNILFETSFSQFSDPSVFLNYEIYNGLRRQWLQEYSLSEMKHVMTEDLKYQPLTEDNYNNCIQISKEEEEAFLSSFRSFCVTCLLNTTYHLDQPFKDDAKQAYSCFGLPEKAAELSGFNDGQGFLTKWEETQNVQPYILYQEVFDYHFTDYGFMVVSKDAFATIGENILTYKDKEYNKKMDVELTTSRDPNNKSGPIGFGSFHHIPTDEPLYYIIHFENKDSATASAQNIYITDTLSSNLDWTTFQFDTTSHIPVVKSFNSSTGIATWTFNNIDLPPNVIPPQGEGWVLYHVNQKANLPSGTQIKNRASIKFDFNDPMLTNYTTNTIDAGTPSSTVKPFATYMGDTTYRIYWSGQDEAQGSGIQDYTIYVSENQNSNYTAWKSNTTDTTALFTGKSGHTYYFYSIARDQVGHVELPPIGYDLVITKVGINEVAKSKNCCLSIYPNPFNDKTTIEFSNPDHKSYHLIINDLFGKTVSEINDITGSKVEIAKGNMAPGVYIVNLVGENALVGKMIIQ